jgi:hypothetical protein
MAGPNRRDLLEDVYWASAITPAEVWADLRNSGLVEYAGRLLTTLHAVRGEKASLFMPEDLNPRSVSILTAGCMFGRNHARGIAFLLEESTSTGFSEA